MQIGSQFGSNVVNLKSTQNKNTHPAMGSTLQSKDHSQNIIGFKGGFVTPKPPMIIGNWKMNIADDIGKYCKNVGRAVKRYLTGWPDEKILPKPIITVCPPEALLDKVQRGFNAVKELVGIGTQTGGHAKDFGAHTGESSLALLKKAGFNIKYAIIGHSERRESGKATDEIIRQEIQSAFNNDVTPIICCGETQETRAISRAAQNTKAVDSFIKKQVKAAFKGLKLDEIFKSVVAYEPRWAIGTGEVCPTNEANRVAKFVRETVGNVAKGTAKAAGMSKAQAREAASKAMEKLRVLYGGSVDQKNIGELTSPAIKPVDPSFLQNGGIDGFLVGGASYKSMSTSKFKATFIRIIKVSTEAYKKLHESLFNVASSKKTGASA